ncbi:spidroin-2-like [Antechinus flavipes]|uniref:spidroin-2-like n=1 Tax=Antechinus flavipes TaxID=38775 RepID=UPI002235F4C1|nr:spidroin-2-like [Antechinus flavipes]
MTCENQEPPSCHNKVSDLPEPKDAAGPTDRRPVKEPPRPGRRSELTSSFPGRDPHAAQLLTWDCRFSLLQRERRIDTADAGNGGVTERRPSPKSGGSPAPGARAAGLGALSPGTAALPDQSGLLPPPWAPSPPPDAATSSGGRRQLARHPSRPSRRARGVVPRDLGFGSCSPGRLGAASAAAAAAAAATTAASATATASAAAATGAARAAAAAAAAAAAGAAGVAAAAAAAAAAPGAATGAGPLGWPPGPSDELVGKFAGGSELSCRWLGRRRRSSQAACCRRGSPLLCIEARPSAAKTPAAWRSPGPPLLPPPSLLSSLPPSLPSFFPLSLSSPPRSLLSLSLSGALRLRACY